MTKEACCVNGPKKTIFQAKTPNIYSHFVNKWWHVIGGRMVELINLYNMYNMKILVLYTAYLNLQVNITEY